MLVYAPKITPRIHYIFQVMLEDVESEISFTEDAAAYQAYDGPKICYHIHNIDSKGFHCVTTGLLEQKEIYRFKIDLIEWQGLPAIIPTSGGDLPFDLFGAAFFLITRYEEYWRFQSDDMGRFSGESSLSHRFGFLQRPIVDLWRMELNKLLKNKWPELIIIQRKYNFISTIDIDHAYAYLYKSNVRIYGALTRDLLKGKFNDFTKRIRVISGKEKDPYDTYDYMDSVHSKYGVRAMYFFLLADLSDYDTGLSYQQPDFRKLIQSLAKKYEVGIHPGVGSYKRLNTMNREKSRLEHIIGAPVVNSRQHYLLLKFRSTYRLLKATGVKHDFTMGYADQVGFRAGTSRPHYWFDVKKDEASNLTIHPFAAMDATMNKYLQMEPLQALNITQKMIEDVKLTGGQFISLWHNETLREADEWVGWREVWEQTIAMAAQTN
jgi:hypothetical protein